MDLRGIPLLTFNNTNLRGSPLLTFRNTGTFEDGHLLLDSHDMEIFPSPSSNTGTNEDM